MTVFLSSVVWCADRSSAVSIFQSLFKHYILFFRSDDFSYTYTPLHFMMILQFRYGLQALLAQSKLQDKTCHMLAIPETVELSGDILYLFWNKGFEKVGVKIL